MTMEISKSTMWQSLSAIYYVLLSGLDLTTILKNSTLYYIEEDGELVSFLTVQDHTSYKHVSTVFTIPRKREEGFATSLLRHVTKGLDTSSFLICKKSIEGFYARFGYETVSKIPGCIRWRYILGSVINHVFTGEETVVMKKGAGGGI